MTNKFPCTQDPCQPCLKDRMVIFKKGTPKNRKTAPELNSCLTKYPNDYTMSFLSWFKELSTVVWSPDTGQQSSKWVKTHRHTLSHFWICETRDPAPAHKTHPTNRALIPENRAEGGFLDRMSNTKSDNPSKRELLQRPGNGPKAHEKDALSISHQGDANQNPLRFHLTPTETAIIKKDSKQVGDATYTHSCPSFLCDTFSSSMGYLRNWLGHVWLIYRPEKQKCPFAP